ncbi:protein 60A-like isoform X2 [Phymastichus coffea]|uniref:protein 60A-like isoform X2 n=1 Tax=Phymastichus coffea TaxID=108790 RepID=UPI00273CB375|nr:protein 60A-like isoform X2 [Phymastichus coffea]
MYNRNALDLGPWASWDVYTSVCDREGNSVLVHAVAANGVRALHIAITGNFRTSKRDASGTYFQKYRFVFVKMLYYEYHSVSSFEMNYSRISGIQLLLLVLSTIQPLGSCQKIARGGIYVENDENQTVPHQFVSRREKRAFVKKILKMLNLPTKVNRSRNATLRLNSPAARFVHDVYRINLGKRDDASSFKFTDADLKTIKDSDVILSYSALSRNGSQAKNKLWFDLSKRPESSNAFRSELQVYVKPTVGSTWRISLFDLEGFVDSINVTKDGWIKFDTGRVLRRWLSCANCSFEVHLSTVNLEHDDDDSQVLVLDEPQNKAFLVGYFVKLYHDSTHMTEGSIRKQRSTTTRNYLENPYSGVYENQRHRKTSCSMYWLHVRFSELDFNKHIVEPDGFDANYCHGECRFPLAAHMNATNHALVQTLVHFIEPGLAPRVLCAPRKYDDLPVFYSHDGDDFAYKIYRQIVVRDCGCC